MRVFLGLFGDRGADPRMAVPERVDGQAAEHVEVAGAVLREEVDALAPVDLQREALVGVEEDGRFAVEEVHGEPFIQRK